MQNRPKTRPTLQQALLKAEKYCAYQERSQLEVKRKLLGMGLNYEEADEILVSLIKSNFLNEERFAQAFSRGKMKVKKWGARKISLALKSKGVQGKLLSDAVGQLPKSELEENMLQLLQKKDKTLKETEPFKRAAKLRNYLVGKGYEPEKVTEAVRKLIGI